ncbi:MAG: hypothetical protein WC382_05620 [Methanoregulaceae archaeon]|jgi:hypothetical protein
MENTLSQGGQDRWVRFGFNETDRGAEAVYEDDGVGVSMEDKTHIFKKGIGKHSGLGLFLRLEILAITGLTSRETGEPGRGPVRIAVPKGAYHLSVVSKGTGQLYRPRIRHSCSPGALVKNIGGAPVLAHEILAITGITTAVTCEPEKGARPGISIPVGSWRSGNERIP